MIYQVTHRSQVDYAGPVAQARYNIRLEPAAWQGQRVLDYRLAITPGPAALRRGGGPWPVVTHRMLLGAAVTEMVITSSFTVAVDPVAPQQGDVSLDTIRAEVLASRQLDAWAPAQYLYASPLVPIEAAIAAWAAPFLTGPGDVLAGARALAHAIYQRFKYAPGTTDSRTTPAEAFAAREGVCQDFAGVMISALRAHGLPSAYVSGYLCTRPPPGRPRLVGADAMHAWVNVWCGAEAGWVGVDPTNDCLAGISHIAVAMGRDYGDVAPVDGVFFGAARQGMRLAVDVVPLGEAPR